MDINQKTFDMWKIGGWSFLIFFALWLLSYLIIPPTFSSTDIMYFKDAGNNFALGSGLVTRIGPGNSEIAPRFYANYPPLFPLIYGLFAKLFGVGPKVSRIFDLLLSTAASLAFWLVVQPRYSDRSTLIPSLLLLALLLAGMPAGPFWGHQERPDNLSFALMIASWAIAQSGHKYRIISSGLLLGINGLISPFGFIINYLGLILFYIIGKNKPKEGMTPLRLINYLFITGFSAALPISLGITLVLWYEPDFLVHFWAHTSGKSIGGAGALGYFISLLSGNLEFYLRAFGTYTNLDQKIKLTYLILTTITIIYFLSTTITKHKQQNRILKIAIMFIAAIPVIIFPYQVNYISLVAAVLIILFACLTKIEFRKAYVMQRWVILFCVFFINIFIIPYEIREMVVAWQSGPSFYRMRSVMEDLNKSFAKKPIIVATTSQNYYLFKGNGFDIVNIDCLGDPAKRSQVDIFALSFVGSRNPLKPNYPCYWDPGEYKLTYHPSLPQQTKIFGHPISNSSNTWEMDLYIRN